MPAWAGAESSAIASRSKGPRTARTGAKGIGDMTMLRFDWDDGIRFAPALMYTDWSAVILLLLTAVPLAAVVATTAFFIWRQKQKR